MRHEAVEPTFLALARKLRFPSSLSRKFPPSSLELAKRGSLAACVFAAEPAKLHKLL